MAKLAQVPGIVFDQFLRQWAYGLGGGFAFGSLAIAKALGLQFPVMGNFSVGVGDAVALGGSAALLLYGDKIIGETADAAGAGALLGWGILKAIEAFGLSKPLGYLGQIGGLGAVPADIQANNGFMLPTPRPGVFGLEGRDISYYGMDYPVTQRNFFDTRMSPAGGAVVDPANFIPY